MATSLPSLKMPSWEEQDCSYLILKLSLLRFKNRFVTSKKRKRNSVINVVIMQQQARLIMLIAEPVIVDISWCVYRYIHMCTFDTLR